jgi:phenylalanyl-tRNA synthetase beta chain
MKIAESWLREWVDPDVDIGALAQRLTMAGHEVDAITAEGEGLDGIVVGEVLEVARHPDADRLSLCRVSAGSAGELQVVCGAPNVVAGMKSPLARPGVTLPNGVKLKKTKIRGVESQGMLCSAAELGLGDDAGGILELGEDAPVGSSLAAYLRLPDTVVDLDLTPNRGDCFSILGIARDVSALTATELLQSGPAPVPPTLDDVHPVEIELPQGCPSFAGRVIRNVDPRAKSPLWMTEKLRRSGLRPIHPVVDVTNYVMLELGQPLHAYDLRLVKGPIRPRLARTGETLTLLDGKTVAPNEDTLVISDDSGAIGLAGIMGGLSTAVSDATVDVFFEAAYWPPEFMAGRARAYGLHTDASLRFERGVDPYGQARAIERASELLLEVAGGEAGPLDLKTAPACLPQPEPVRLRRARLATLLGVDIGDSTVESVLRRLGFDVATVEDGWDVTAPAYRFDVAIEVDLIEEVARIYGYDEIPESTAIAETPLEIVPESSVTPGRAASVLIARDYQEVVTYSFVDPTSNTALSGSESPLELSNPISSEMSVMRSSLLPGMLRALSTNVARQQDRVRLFEIGKSFHGTLDAHDEVLRIAGAVTGDALPEQWGTTARPIDFFDIKSDVEALLALSGATETTQFLPVDHPALQPGQAAAILRDGQEIGLVGKLHPRHRKLFELKRDVFVFELDADRTLAASPPRARPISKFPSIRRDIAILVSEQVSAADLLRVAAASAPELISSVRIFDVYQGPGIEAGLKSVALGLILQETSRTLTDEDADSAMAAAVTKLKENFAAELRD